MEYLFEEVVMIHKGRLLLHEPYGDLIEQGASVTGGAEEVDRFRRDDQTEQPTAWHNKIRYGLWRHSFRKKARSQGKRVGHRLRVASRFIHSFNK